MGFEDFFRSRYPGRQPYPYQHALAKRAWPETLIVPTGFGKTAAILGAWLWKRRLGDPATPRRLVYCLPMRTLVEQTATAAVQWIEAARSQLGLEVGLEIAMGGQAGELRGVPAWIRDPDRPTILVGTQDLLVSAALMRGYGVTRYRWPVDFALLHNDALWVFDEVQLTGATLATSAQIEAFRRRFATARPCRTLWMSATLDPGWLRTVDFVPTDGPRHHDLSAVDLESAAPLWQARKSLCLADVSADAIGTKDGLPAYAAAVAGQACVLAKPGQTTLVFLNTVGRAQAVYHALGDRPAGPERLLVHSRFRMADRARLMARLAETPPVVGRIVVATQALEAGVDLTSSTLLTEIAPWSSLVQRFGRCNRYGECNEEGAKILWIDLPDAAARPYEPQDLAEARDKLAGLSACGPADLTVIAPSKIAHGAVIRARDFLDLFDTDPDLSGHDIDIALYVRDADDTDVRIFWRPVDGPAPSEAVSAPSPAELCPAPIAGAKALLDRKGVRAWRWDTLLRAWRCARAGDIFPGVVLWFDADTGGYDRETGFDAASRQSVPVVEGAGDAERDMSDDDDALTTKVRVSLVKHSAHVRDQAARLAESLQLSRADRDLLVEAGLWHDLGKAHEAFVAMTTSALGNGAVPPLAKWPKAKDQPQPHVKRKFFRHELASALAYLATRDWSETASLGAYLIAAHHGKVRMRLGALPKETAPPEDGRLFARGVWNGDELPETRLGDIVVSATGLDLDIMQLGEGRCGPSWSARAQALLKLHGPFKLAWLEALLRIADWHASAAEEEAGHDDL